MEKKDQHLPTSVVLQLTEVCNLRCKMCYAWGETGCYSNAPKRKPVVMDFDLIKRIIHELAPARPAYSLFGGEPLMHPQLEQVIQLIKDTKSVVDTPTNGTLLEKNAAMLVRTGFDSIRVSIDGPQKINDAQRGKGSYNRAMAGIEALYQERKKAGKKRPIIGIIYTVTSENYHSIEEFFLESLNLSAINWITIQMENFVTEKMGESYAKLLRSRFGLTSEEFWRGLVRTPEDFRDIDTIELARQVNEVCNRLLEQGINTLLLPPTFSPENLNAYLGARWDSMTDKYVTCPVPWTSVDITATGDVAPCHVFYDLIMGNLYKHNFVDIWNGDKFRSFREYIKSQGLMSICPGCCILYIVGKKVRKGERTKKVLKS